MKWIKYLLSGAAILLLTVLVMLFPNAYQQHADRQETPAAPRDILLEQTVEKPTASEMLRLIIDSLYIDGSYVAIETERDKTAEEYTADCRQILEDVFGNKEESKTTALLLERLEQGKNVQVQTYQVVMLAGNDVLTNDFVSAQYGDMSIWYEEEHRIALHIAVDSSRDDSVSSPDWNEKEALFDFASEQAAAVEAYYRALGLKDGEFVFSIYNSDYLKYLSVELTPEYEDVFIREEE